MNNNVNIADEIRDVTTGELQVFRSSAKLRVTSSIEHVVTAVVSFRSARAQSLDMTRNFVRCALSVVR